MAKTKKQKSIETLLVNLVITTFAFGLTDEVEDLITGLKGIVIGQNRSLTGNSYLVTPRIYFDEGNTGDVTEVAEPRLKLVKRYFDPRDLSFGAFEPDT